MAQRIQDLIGFDYASNSINTENEAIETAIAEVIDALPDEVLLKYALVPTDLISSAATMNIEGKKILRVIRFEGANVVGRVCDKVDIDEYKNISVDSDSIYYPTKHSPVYTENPETATTVLEVFPAITGGSADTADTAKIYYIPYDAFGDVDHHTAFDGLPNEVEHAVALKACTYIIQTMISDTVQDDEDEEMLAMLTSQSQSLQQMYQIEMTRLSGEKGEQ